MWNTVIVSYLEDYMHNDILQKLKKEDSHKFLDYMLKNLPVAKMLTQQFNRLNNIAK